ncbi:MAG: sugar phosphate isomerase/epimerase [Candidatus Lokiarchaeota archaeon]|nr:sugar phosphate isomerase/epimerase [Candidatus Harpocratesius repetitus]
MHFQEKIFVSSSCLKPKLSISEIVDLYLKNKINKIELGSSHKYEENIISKLKKKKKENPFECTIHAYFPPLEDSFFFVNLASNKPKIALRSKNFVKKMIDYSAELDAKMCSFHSGFRWDPVDSLKYNGQEIYDYDKSYQIFLQNIKEICIYAEKKNVPLAFEPNVVSANSLINGKNLLLMMCEHDEIRKLYKDLEDTGIRNLQLLLDVGHLKVTANNLNYSFDDFIKEFKKYIGEIHIHDNDGLMDTHDQITQNSKIGKVLESLKNEKDMIFTLEAGKLSIDEIKEQKELLRIILY